MKPADGHDTTCREDPSVHGNGPVQVSVGGFPTELDERVVDTSKKLGGRFPYTVDLNAGHFVGVSESEDLFPPCKYYVLIRGFQATCNLLLVAVSVAVLQPLI